jgi:hypothetical protein
LHHDIPGRVKAVDNTFSHDRGQQFGRLHPGQTAVTRRGESERCYEVVARAGIGFSGASDIRAQYRNWRTKQELIRSPISSTRKRHAYLDRSTALGNFN